MKKFFSEFASCWGGATVVPTAEAAGARRQTEEQRAPRRSKSTAKVSGAAANWRPKLNAISENSPMSDTDDRKRPVRAKPKSPARAAPPPSPAADYWKYSHTMALPVFAPTSYLF
ncbi:uncharacterized protein LOC131012635 [Salvia miltiorrhiza]|uniref:uncharacterized protein LOC131012635 n=1 Tax=Salvia miltiorrhiza TaxID=226208 RepID=UPI0025ABCAA5|nr:uncharacterized protein LOC131012635 [Salvia miltiorrhiza]